MTFKRLIWIATHCFPFSAEPWHWSHSFVTRVALCHFWRMVRNFALTLQCLFSFPNQGGYLHVNVKSQKVNSWTWLNNQEVFFSSKAKVTSILRRWLMKEFTRKEGYTFGRFQGNSVCYLHRMLKGHHLFITKSNQDTVHVHGTVENKRTGRGGGGGGGGHHLFLARY